MKIIKQQMKEWWKKDMELPNVIDFQLKKVTMQDGVFVYVDNDFNIYSHTMHKLTQRINNKGYYYVMVRTKTNSHSPRFVHRILAQAFIKPDLNDAYEVHHKDRNPLNNSLDNLEPLLRYDHKIEHQQIYPLTKICKVCGKVFIPKPTKRKRAQVCSPECKKVIDDQTHMNKRKAINQYDLNGCFIKRWDYGSEIQNELGYMLSNICKCCKHIINSSYGYRWEYADD